MQVATHPTMEQPPGTPPPDDTPLIVGLSPGQLFWRVFRSDRLALVSVVFLLLMIVMAVGAPLIARDVVHHDPNRLFIDEMLDQFSLPRGPNAHFWFGADDAGATSSSASSTEPGPPWWSRSSLPASPW